MQIHSLGFNDLYEDDFSLIGIHTTLEDFKLAYLLNQKLSINFKKSKNEIRFSTSENPPSFSYFEYHNIKFDFEWVLIANSSKRENQTEPNELLLTTETKSYLIPEKKKVDFFIKISGELQYHFIAETVDKVKKIDQIITSYPIDKNTLKSKDFLIF